MELNTNLSVHDYVRNFAPDFSMFDLAEQYASQQNIGGSFANGLMYCNWNVSSSEEIDTNAYRIMLIADDKSNGYVYSEGTKHSISNIIDENNNDMLLCSYTDRYDGLSPVIIIANSRDYPKKYITLGGLSGFVCWVVF